MRDDIIIHYSAPWNPNKVFSEELEHSLSTAVELARNHEHEFVTVEHLLLSMLDDATVREILDECGADIQQLKSDLEFFLSDNNIPHANWGDQVAPRSTHGFRRVLQRALLHVQNSGQGKVHCKNVLIAIFGENESHAVYFLHAQNIQRYDVVRYVAHGIGKLKIESEDESLIEGEINAEESENNPVKNFLQNLNESARLGKIDPLIGREPEIDRTIQILCRRRKNNPLFVGDAGVGKTAIAEGLAKRIYDEQVPNLLSDCRIYALDMGSLLAGTKYRGDFEQRLKSVVKELKKDRGAILFIDEIHTVIGAGAASGGTMDASNILKPLLVSDELRCMGSTTYQEYRGIFEKDRALARRFQKIDVLEPSIDETVDILRGLKSSFELYHSVRYTIPALRAAVELANRYITDRKLPDKAIDVIDEAGAYSRLQTGKNRKKTVGVKDIERIVSRIARVPPRTVSASDIKTLRNIERDLKLVVFGQDEAIETLGSAIKLSRSGLANPDKPISSFLFSGPTGVGKTEVARQLAMTLGIELIRFDMSEYMEPHTVSRLIGAPPGYVGFDQGGLLTETVNKSPHAVLLLDEIEKAHNDVFNILLQVMDYGTLTDNNGRKTDFRNVVIIMTTNTGATEISRSSIGFMEQDHSIDDMPAIQRRFSPEFRNRIDAIIRFNALEMDTILLVVDKFLMELEQQLADKGVEFTVGKKAREWLAEKGFDSAMGARPMERVIQENIKKKLADEVLFGKLVNGGKLHVVVKGDSLDLKFTSAEEKLES